MGSSTRSGRPMMSTRAVPSTRRRPRSSCRTPLVTLDQETSSLMKLSMWSSPHSTRTTPEPSRRTKWLSSSSNFLADNEHAHYDQDSYNEDQRQSVVMEAR